MVKRLILVCMCIGLFSAVEANAGCFRNSVRQRVVVQRQVVPVRQRVIVRQQVVPVRQRVVVRQKFVPVRQQVIRQKVFVEPVVVYGY